MQQLTITEKILQSFSSNLVAEKQIRPLSSSLTLMDHKTHVMMPNRGFWGGNSLNYTFAIENWDVFHTFGHLLKLNIDYNDFHNILPKTFKIYTKHQIFERMRGRYLFKMAWWQCHFFFWIFNFNSCSLQWLWLLAWKSTTVINDSQECFDSYVLCFHLWYKAHMSFR